jgi:hypothetical protein
MLYVYAIVRAEHDLPDIGGIGVPSGQLHLISGRGIAAVVSDADAEHQIDEDDARTHLDVLIALLEGGPVVPVKLGTVLADESDVRSVVLETGAEDLLQRLDALDGMIEVQLDADDDEAEAFAALAESAPDLQSPGGDMATRIEFGKQVAEMLIEHRQRLAQNIVERLAHLAVDHVPRSELSGPEDPLLRWAFLIRQDDLRLFDDAVLELRSEHPSLSFHYVGPLPAAHFVQRLSLTSSTADTFRGEGAWGW